MIREPTEQSEWVARFPAPVRTGPIGETGFTERLAHVFSIWGNAAQAMLCALATGVRRERTPLLHLPLVSVATFGRGPDLLLAFGDSNGPLPLQALVIEHKRFNLAGRSSNSHAVRRRPLYEKWPEGHDGLSGPPGYNFNQHCEIFTTNGEEAMWQLDATRFFPMSWLPGDMCMIRPVAWLFLDAADRTAKQAFSPKPEWGAELGVPQSLADWDSLGYCRFATSLRQQHEKLQEAGDAADAEILASVLRLLYT